MSNSSTKIRLDQLIVQRGLTESREKARALIMAGLVEVEGSKAVKSGQTVSMSAAIHILEPLRYVSRGGLKLEAALQHFCVDVKGRTWLDVGASTGGFTDCLLQHGAGRVISVDVGYGQFDWKLRNDPRVTLLEKTNIRYLKREDFNDGPINGAVIDVSFISLKLVVPVLSELLETPAFIIALIKPQFEVGKGRVGKGGVVRDSGLHEEVIEELKVFFSVMDWKVEGCISSPILGPKGNREFLMYMRR
jgi:23S rRNA (cytidine1920-2'-O)/16S rRNA (cytidine1409-2'-O)-methyltransferase